MTRRPPAQNPSLANAGSAVCHHMDGIAIGMLVSELLAQGVFEDLKKTRPPLNVNALAHSRGARIGYFHAAMRLLAHQGFVRLDGNIPEGETNVQLTDQGKEWLGLVDYYEQVPGITDTAASLKDVLESGRNVDGASWSLPDVPLGTGSRSLSRRVSLHLYGWLAAVAAQGLWEKGFLHKISSGMSLSAVLGDLCPAPGVRAFIADILRAQGWTKGDSEELVLTTEGQLVASFAVQYAYPVSYLRLFRSIPQLLFGSGSFFPPVSDPGHEYHIDRSLDVRFSGEVFERRCKGPFLEIVLPMFDREPVDEQPSCIVDTGSGDGTLLVTLYRAITQGTLRGRMLKAHPLRLVGVEYTSVGIEATNQALRDIGCAHLVMFGDIADPFGISRKLAEHGIDPQDTLHVNKSVIHNRRYKPPQQINRRDAWRPVSHVPFVSETGELIPARDLECNLVEFFEDWIPFTHKHGMVCIEAHTVDPLIVSRSIGANMITSLDATHEFSHQYLVEYGAFLNAARTAGYNSRAKRLLAGWLPDHPILAIHHFVPEDSWNSDIQRSTPLESYINAP